MVCAYWGGSVSHQIMLRAEKTAETKISAMLRTAVRVSMQGLLNKCNLVYLAEWGMKDFSPILHNSLWGGPWNNFESTSNNCFAQRVILVSGVTRVQSTPMCSCSCNFDNKQLFVFLWYILKKINKNNKKLLIDFFHFLNVCVYGTPKYTHFDIIFYHNHYNRLSWVLHVNNKWTNQCMWRVAKAVCSLTASR